MNESGENVQSTEQVEQSAILTPDEVEATLSGTPTEEEVILPSETEEFELPEKFKGKSLEEIAKAYVELEKMKAQANEEVFNEEGTPNEEVPDDVEEDTILEDAYANYVATGELDEGTLQAIADAGYDTDEVIEQMEFAKYKQEKVINEVLEPLGGGTEKLQQVAAWALEAKGEEAVASFNEALANSSLEAQRLLIKGLYAEYDANTDADDASILHSGDNQVIASKGYATQEEFFKDIGSPEYKNNPKFRAKVEAKMAKSNIF